MSICPLSLGYNWKGQECYGVPMETREAVVLNLIKIGETLPIVCMVASVVRIFFTILMIKEEFSRAPPQAKVELILSLARGVAGFLHLGVGTFLIMDLFMTCVNGPLSYRANKDACEFDRVAV